MQIYLYNKIMEEKKVKKIKRKLNIIKMPSLRDARMRLDKETKIYHFNLDSKLIGLGRGKFYHLKTYGCQGNLADSEKMAGILEKMGYKRVDTDEEADVIIFNTCAIRENAENRVFGELGRIKSLKKQKPSLIMGICGCMSQEEHVVNTIKDKYPQVDLVFGTHNIHMLGEYLYEIINNNSRIIDVLSYEGDIIEEVPVIRESNKKAWVNIMYGCDEFCTYCIVPYTRGRERSRMPKDIIREVEELAKEGYIEVTLLGQNVNAYGKDLGINYTFSNLLDDLNKTDIKRIRFTTSHPRDLDLETIKVMGKGGNIMPHLHLPVQSGSNEILKKMNRKYTKEEYLEKIKLLNEYVPGISITTDIIVAFPGETESDFEETLDLVRKSNFEGAFTFIFSPRVGTPAYKMENNLTESEKKERLLKLNDLINEGFLRGNKRFEGETLEVLVDGVSEKDSSVLSGYTKHEKLVNFIGTKDLIGKLVNVKITKAYSWHLYGEVVS